MSRETRTISTRWEKLRNLRMAEKLSEGEAFDISGCERTSDGSYILTGILAEEAERQEGADFCDAKTESWIWSIGKNYKTKEVLAALDTKYYCNPEYQCLWLR